MEDSVLYMLERGQLYRLFEEDIHIANWGRKFAEKELLKTEERLIPLLFTTLRSVTANCFATIRSCCSVCLWNALPPI